MAARLRTGRMIRVCFVCLGNICRSPTAEGVLLQLVEERKLSHLIAVESAGTAAYHEGEGPDRRSIQAAKARGIPVGGRARQFVARDFERFDYVLALDEQNLANLERLKPAASPCHLGLLLDFDAESSAGSSVPDPYYGGREGFDLVIDLCQRACHGLLTHILEQQARRRSPQAQHS
jgi:protein-tyrosine phosphatase